MAGSACRSVLPTSRSTSRGGRASWRVDSVPLDVTVATEPGEFIAKQTGVHLAEVVTVEDREGTTFVGLDTGWNALCEHFVYGIPFFPILCRAADADACARHDVRRDTSTRARSVRRGPPVPRGAEGDIVALPNVGSYNASMASFHCMRERRARCCSMTGVTPALRSPTDGGGPRTSVTA